MFKRIAQLEDGSFMEYEEEDVEYSEEAGQSDVSDGPEEGAEPIIAVTQATPSEPVGAERA